MWVCQVLKQQTPPEKKKGWGLLLQLHQDLLRYLMHRGRST